MKTKIIEILKSRNLSLDQKAERILSLQSSEGEIEQLERKVAGLEIMNNALIKGEK